LISKDNSKQYRNGWKNRDMDEDAVKTAIRGLDLRSALEFYGLVFNRQGAALCPFHGEKTASLRVKNRYWHCFGCGETGDLIKFVRRSFGLGYRDALRTICGDFGLSCAPATKEERLRVDNIRRQRRESIEQYDRLLAALDLRTELYLTAWDSLQASAKLFGGATVDNTHYVAAQFELMCARNALEAAESACAQFLRDNPSATPVPPSAGRYGAVACILPPANMSGTAARSIQCTAQ